MRLLVKNYYKYLGQIEEEVTVFLETCVEIVQSGKDIPVDLMFDVTCIEKINKKMHGSARIAFLCELVDEAVLGLFIKTGGFSEDACKPAKKETQKEHSKEHNKGPKIDEPKSLMEELIDNTFLRRYEGVRYV